MGLNEAPRRIGEVIQASTTEFLAQCYELHQPPPLGSWVTAREGDIDIYAVVGQATTESLDPTRQLVALGQELDTEADIFRHHPQVEKLLRTSFRALVVGHRLDNRLLPHLPPRPARLHSFVFSSPPGDIGSFAGRLDFLGLLLSAQGTPVHEVVAACLRHLAQTQPDAHAFLVQAGKELTLRLRGEVTTLNDILRRLEP